MTELARIEPAHHEVATTTVVNDPTGGRLVAWAEGLQAAHRIGSALCRTTFVPKHFQNKPEDAAAAILFGDEIGLTPTQALRSIHVISGTPGLYARSMVALVLAHGHEVWTDKDTAEEVVVCGRRKGSSRIEKSSWTTARARKAGYTSNKKYETDPQSMLYARAASDVCRKVAPDALAGLTHTVEEMQLDEVPSTGTRSTRRTVKRAELPPAPEPDLEPEKEQPRQAKAEAEPPVEPERQPEPDPITSSQSKKMHASFNDAGITERADRMAYVVDVIGRHVESSKELTKHEATLVIDALVEKQRDTQQGEEPTFDEGDPWAK
jgi:hypothetical protein